MRLGTGCFEPSQQQMSFSRKSFWKSSWPTSTATQAEKTGTPHRQREPGHHTGRENRDTTLAEIIGIPHQQRKPGHHTGRENRDTTLAEIIGIPHQQRKPGHHTSRENRDTKQAEKTGTPHRQSACGRRGRRLLTARHNTFGPKAAWLQDVCTAALGRLECSAPPMTHVPK